QAPRQRVVQVHAHPQERPGDVELLTRQRVLASLVVELDQVVSHGNAEQLGELGRTSDRQNCAAGLQERLELRDRRGGGDIAASATVFGGDVLPGPGRRGRVDLRLIAARVR